MNESERTNLLNILNNVIKSLKDNNLTALKDLSNQTIHDASIMQERHSITLAVLIYSLNKIYEREYSYSQLSGWKKICVNCDSGLIFIRNFLEKGDYVGFDNALKQYMKSLEKVDTKLKGYIGDVLDKARINKASRIYEHGISIGRTAELLGITRFELMDYVGKTHISDVKESITISPKARLKIARGLFL